MSTTNLDFFFLPDVSPLDNHSHRVVLVSRLSQEKSGPATRSPPLYYPWVLGFLKNRLGLVVLPGQFGHPAL